MSEIIRINNNSIQITDLLEYFMIFKDDERLTPSRYMEEVAMTVEERLKILNDRSRKQRIGRRNKLWTIPDIVVFQNFETHVKYSTTISFMHQKQHPVRIKVYPDLSPCFRLKELPGTVYSKLAPGTPHKMILDFYSEEFRDYSCSIRFEADEDVVILPIAAVAPRPIIIFPDVIEMTPTVVNICSDKKVFMRNMGKRSVVFKLKADSPFSVCPTTGIMEPNEVLDVKVSYKTFRVEKNVSHLVISFEGVDLYATLKCEAKNCDIYLDKTILHFEDTFLNLQRCISLNLVNNSDYAMKYQWKQFKTKYDDFERCKKFRLKLHDMNEYEVLRNIQEENQNITDAELHRIFLERMYQDELEEFDSTDQFLFHDVNFRFSEKSGVIGPHSVVNIEVVFCPNEAEYYHRIAYLDVTGRETRQPLKMVGNGLGPVVALNFKLLDVENLYLCAKHQYEVVAKNEGNIPATLRYCHKSMEFGGSMSCTPDEVCISPGKCEKMVLEFSSTVQGKFLENLDFKILESGENVNCVFQGNVVCPLLSYDVEEINFGVVAFGFVIEKEVTIENKTEVPIEFQTCVLNDGRDEAITWETFAQSHNPNLLSRTPKEFSIHPEEATVAGNSSISIKITLLPNREEKRSTFLRTYMWGTKKHFVEIPLYYKCVVANIESFPSRLDIRYCFIHCPYARQFTIKNTSSVPGYIIYNAEKYDHGLSCELSLTESFMEPAEEKTIQLEIKGSKLGLRTKYLNFTTFGNKPATLCRLTCDVQGPVICVSSEEIHFGHVNLLTWHSRQLQVMNDSPVSACISIHALNSTFHVNPSDFKLEASEKLEVDISIYLTDVAKYTSFLILNIADCMAPLKVFVSAFGVGSCILFEPHLEPEYNLGTMLTHNTFKFPFKMTNMGKESHRLFFSNINDVKKTDIPIVKGKPLNIEPHLLELQHREENTGFIELFHTAVGRVESMYYCYEVSKTGKCSKIFDVNFIAHFEDPMLVLSKQSLHFGMDVTVDKTDAYLEELFTMMNNSFLALDILVHIDTPFYIIDEYGTRRSELSSNVGSKEEFSFVVQFVPPKGLKKCTVSTGTMKIGFRLHPKVIKIPLIGDVHYPTLLTFPEIIKDQNIFPMTHGSTQLIIKNISPLPAVFMFEWDVSSYVIEKLKTPRHNLSSIESSISWNLKKGNEFTENAPSIDQENTYLMIQNMLLDDEEQGDLKPFSLKDTYKTLIENVRFPHLHPNVMKKLLFDIKYILFPITQALDYNDQEYLQILENMPSAEVEINEAMLNISPYQGCLQPFECSLVNFYIRPPSQSSLKATLKCKVLGGAEEEIDISAVCGEIAYDIDKLELLFGHQLFCENLEDQILLSNTGHVSFEYAVLDDITNPKHKALEVAAVGVLTVTPNMGTLKPNETTSLLVSYYPGKTGQFAESFTIEIGYLGPISIRVGGTAVYSQLYIDLPRPNLFEVSEIYQCYTAIGNICKDLSYLHYNMKDIPENVKLDEITTSFLEQEEWYIVEHDDVNIPSKVDIDMAIERMLALDFFQNNVQLSGQRLSFKRYFTIPNYEVPPYDLLLGNVRLDGHYEHNVPVYNYGPTACLVRLWIHDRKSVEKKGFLAELNCKKIKPKSYGNLNVKFTPYMKGADYTNPYISEVIYIEVNQGARIPIRISACVGTPKTKLNSHCLDFCGVVVGSCKRKILCMYNVGFVEARWTCTIDSPIFFTRKKGGLLYAGESEDIEVYFEPKAKGPRQGLITFNIDGNGEELNVHLNGYGREPSFVIKEKVVEFPPVLQYSSTLEESFLIQNTSSFTTEIVLCDFDRQIALHERICNVVWRVINPRKIYVAKSRFESPPSEIYRFLLNELYAGRLRRGRNSCWGLMKGDTRVSSDSIERLLESLELKSTSSVSLRRPPQDIFIDPETDEGTTGAERKGSVIVFYGNKYADYLKAATKASKLLQLPRFTLDGMIIDILVENKTAYTREINQIIDDAYLVRMKSDECLCKTSMEDGVDTLWKKLDVIITTDYVPKPKSYNMKFDKEKQEKLEEMSVPSSKNSRKTNSANISDTFLRIPEDKIVQILKDRIDQMDSMILESLDSIFLPYVPAALKCFLKAVKNISCVYFVFLTCTIEYHNALIAEEEEQIEAREIEKRQAVNKKMVDSDEFSLLTDEERDVLLGIMEEKRRKSRERRLALRYKIQERLVSNNQIHKANDLRSLWMHMDNAYLRNQAYKVQSKAMRILEATQQSSNIVLTKDRRDSKGSKSPREKSPEKFEIEEDTDTQTYFHEYDNIMKELLFLLENWSKTELEAKKDVPNLTTTTIPDNKDAKLTAKEWEKKIGKTKKSPGTFAAVDIDAYKDAAKSTSDPNSGYPVWLINRAHEKGSGCAIEPIINLLKELIRVHCLNSTETVCNDSEVEYTVLKNPAERIYREKPEVFDLVKAEGRGESCKLESSSELFNVDEAQKTSAEGLSVLQKRKPRKRKLTLLPTESDMEEIKKFSTRFVLEPGNIQEITVIFKPLHIGFFNFTYQFEVVGTHFKETILVKASCDHPRIDTSPTTLFPHHVHNIDSKSMFLNGIYIISQQTLDFGNILLIPKHLLKMKSSISLLNTSGILCELSLSFKGESSVFYCDEDQMNIEVKPGRQHVLSVYAKPPKEGPFYDTLLIVTKNNPRVAEIHLSCFACPLKFEVMPKIVNYNKVMLGKTEIEKMTLSNYTAAMIYFEFEVDANSEFKISRYNGYLEPCSSIVVTVTFLPELIGERKETLVLKVFDKEKQFPHPIHVEVLSVLAEVTTFPLEYLEHVDLGLVKGKVPHIFHFVIENKGKYDVKIVLTKPNDQGDGAGFTDYFKMKQMEYVVEGESKYSNNCKFLCDREISFVDYPVVHVDILDNYRNASIDHFTLKASVKVALSKFEICPHGDFYFGYQNVNTTRSSLLSLKNTGNFEFKYAIMTSSMIEEQVSRKESKKGGFHLDEIEPFSSEPSVTEIESTIEKKSVDKSTRSTDTKKGRKNKKKSDSSLRHPIQSITAGVFTVYPATGFVELNQTVLITIESKPTNCEKYRETIIIFVSEPNPDDKRGCPLNLHVEGAEPRINFDDFIFMFPMQYVVEKIHDLPFVGQNFVFETNKKKLNFGKVALNNSVSTKFRVPNTGHVTATIQYDLKEKDSCFSIQSRLVDIAPYKAEFNTIEFIPKAIGIWTGTLEMKCLGCSNGQDINTSIQLMGEGCMPTIEIMNSEYLQENRDAQICFGPIPLKTTCERTVVIKNTGQVSCKVIVDIVGDPEWGLSLHAETENESDEQTKEREGDYIDYTIVNKHSDIMTLSVGEKGFIKVLYEAKSTERIEAELTFIVINNCFDVWKVNMHTFAFDVPVSIVNLPARELSESFAYALDFGTVEKDELYKICFKIRNLSNSIYRFQFAQIKELIFAPNVGHLYEGSEKTIIAAFRTKRHLAFNEKEIPLTIAKIKLLSESIEPSLPWDDRQNCPIAQLSTTTSDDPDLSYVPCVQDALYDSNEPVFEAIEMATLIPIIVNAQCGYAHYFCEIRELNFPATNMHSRTSEIINVENRSRVNLGIAWSLVEFLEQEDEENSPRPSLFEKMQKPNEATLKTELNEYENCPFSIEPDTYIIPPEQNKEFVVSFTPKNTSVQQYFVSANMKNLDPEMKDLVITLRGESQYFPYRLGSPFMENFEASDCRFRTYCGLLVGFETKILNFLSLGLGSECNRSMFIENNSPNPFSFIWRNIKIDNEKTSYFHCEFNKGYVVPGKTTKTNFIFMPQTQGEFTDYYQFEPDDPNIPRTSLLLQGACRDPKVFFENASITLGATLINNSIEEEIILRNDEELKIHFSFKKHSLFSDNQQIMNIAPISGLMESNSRTKIRLSLRGTKEGTTVFSPHCVVQYMNKPIHFNFLMTVVDVSAKLIYFGRGKDRTDVQPNIPLIIDLGVIIPHKMEEMIFELENTSSIGFYYSWMTEDKEHMTRIRFNKKIGFLRSFQKIVFSLSLQALRKCILKNTLVKLKILYGPIYIIKLKASSQKPKFTFSFLSYDFGKCLIQKEPTKFYKAPLVFKNNNSWPVVLEYDQNNVMEFLIDFKSAIVDTGKMKTVDIYFSPTKHVVYETSFNFFVDSQKVILKLFGEGVPLFLEVFSLTDKFLDFGRVRVGKTVQKSVKVINTSETYVDVIFHLSSKVRSNQIKNDMEKMEFCIEPAHGTSVQEEVNAAAKSMNKKKGKTDKNMQINSTEKLLKNKKPTSDHSKNFIIKSLEKFHTDSEMHVMNSREALKKFSSQSFEIFPKNSVRIFPNRTVDLVVKFKPTEAKDEFQSKIYYQVQNNNGPIVTILGSAVDASFNLNKDVINFGNIVIGYAGEENIILINDGYIGGKFRWSLEKNSNYISFIEGEGYSPPNSKVMTTIVFKPGHVQCVFKFKAYCQIENYKKKLELILTGGSMNLPPPIETLQFTAAVREECVQNIEFRNDSKDTWNTEPVFTGNSFFGASTLRVPKETSVTYQIHFTPLKMNPPRQKGTIFFPLTSGVNRLYALEGIVTPPNPVAEISRDICCKTYHSEILKVENWIGLRQQFKITSEVVGGGTTKMIYKITSNDHFELPPYGKRDFKWIIYVVNEGKLSFKVTFLNEETGEFLYYLIKLKISTSEIAFDNIEFVTCVRTASEKKITVKNPLPEPVEYTVAVSSPYVMTNNSFLLLPYEKYKLSVTYLPVKVETTSAVLTISNPVVGSYAYNLILEAQAPNSEPEVQFRTFLGQSISKTILLPGLLQNSDATAQITDSRAFEVLKLFCQSEKPYVDVLFFPPNVGTTRTSLQIKSCVGDYTYPLIGESLPPEPHGPILIVLGDSVNIEINNPFEENMIFQFRVDNNIFIVKPSEDAIKAKKSMKITVSTIGKRVSRGGSAISNLELMRSGILTGKLTVISENNVEWVYYLQCQVYNK